VKSISEGIETTIGDLQNKTLSGVHSWKPGRKSICSRLYNASTAFPVNVAEAT
jgi:hypothetical protein